MIPLYISIPCIILILIVICRWFITSDTDWEEVFMIAKGIAIVMIFTACTIVSIFSILQWFIFGVK